MKRIVWVFGDGSVQFTPVDRRRAMVVNTAEGERLETEDEQITRLILTRAPRLSPLRLDLTVRTEDERRAYEAELGAGATPTMAGVISGEEYDRMCVQARTYREGWTWTSADPVIDIDMAKCREIHRGMIRRARAPLLAKLDVDAQKAIEIGDKAELARVASSKKQLRDAPALSAIQAAKTLDDLKIIWPDYLKGGKP